jgi:hypothetical protein
MVLILGPIYNGKSKLKQEKRKNSGVKRLRSIKGLWLVTIWMQETQERSKHLLMINFVLITTIFVLMPMPITISNVNAGGPRLDYDERYEDVPGAPECWVNEKIVILLGYSIIGDV